MASKFSSSDEDEADKTGSVTNTRVKTRDYVSKNPPPGHYDRVRDGTAVATSRTAKGWCRTIFC